MILSLSNSFNTMDTTPPSTPPSGYHEYDNEIGQDSLDYVYTNHFDMYAKYGHDDHDDHDDDDYMDGYSDYDGYSEYESDTSSHRSLHSYSSNETSHAFDYSSNVVSGHNLHVPTMTSIAEDFEIIRDMLQSPVVRTPLVTKGCIATTHDKSKTVHKNEDEMVDVKSDTSSSDDEKSVLSISSVVVPWKKVENNTTISLTNIIQDEVHHQMKETRLKEQKAQAERNARSSHENKYRQSGNDRNNNNQRRRERKSPPTHDQNHDHRDTPRRRSLLLGGTDPKPPKAFVPSQTQTTKNHQKDTGSVSSKSSTTTDLSRLCKFGKACSETSKCGRAHTFEEWCPRRCRAAKSCKSPRQCTYIHQNESKQVYLKRIVEVHDTFYHKNRQIYLKNFKSF